MDRWDGSRRHDLCPGDSRGLKESGQTVKRDRGPRQRRPACLCFFDIFFFFFLSLSLLLAGSASLSSSISSVSSFPFRLNHARLGFLSCSFFSLAFSEKAEKSIFGCFLGASSSSESNSYGCPRTGASASTMPQVSSHDDPKRGCPSGGSDGRSGTQRTSSSSSSCSTSTPKRSSSRRVRSSRMMRSSASRHCRKSSRF